MSVNNTIWFVNFYASKIHQGVPGRHYYFSQELASRGYKVCLFAAGYHHLARVSDQELSKELVVESVDGFDFVTVPNPRYSNAHSVKRFYSEIVFAASILRAAKDERLPKPDLIVYSSPGLLPYLGVSKLAKKVGAGLIFDVRDIWPLTLIEIGGLSKRNPLIKVFQHIEDLAYREAQGVMSNWPGVGKHVVERGFGSQKIEWIPNGFSEREFDEKRPLDDWMLKKIPSDKFVVVYTGTLGKANALDTLIWAAELLLPHKEICVLIAGEGKDKDYFYDVVAERGLDNIVFLGALPKQQIPSLLQYADVCYVGFLKNPIYRFGSSLTKLPEYMYSGKPVVYASSSTYQPISMAGAGLTVEAEDFEGVANAILSIYRMSKEERRRLGEAGRDYAIKNFEYSRLTSRMLDFFDIVLCERS